MKSSVERVLSIFRSLSEIPRPSKHEKRAADWVEAWATRNGYPVHRDDVHNLVISLPGRGPAANGETVVLQGHLDMVCEATPDKNHDCENDPIATRIEDGWLTADGTTLGADNGIAVATCLALAADESLTHPPLELLFTTDEETGLNGAKKLSPEAVSARRLINIDSETEGTFVVGCAGGRDTTITIPVDRAPSSSSGAFYQLTVTGLAGGHSGVDIKRPLGNANKILARALSAIPGTTRIVEAHGGSAHNAIPRDAAAIFWSSTAVTHTLQRAVDELSERLQQEVDAKNLSLSIEPRHDASAEPLTEAATRRVLDVLSALPHGVDRMSPSIEGLVETSSNLATVRTSGTAVTILMSQRSSTASRLEAITDQIGAIGRLAGASVSSTQGYPPWEPDLDSPLLRHAKSVYIDLYGREPTVDVIHAGLECGVIGAIYPGMDMLSVGPTIRGAHSPDERLDLNSLERLWEFLTKLLGTLSE